MAETFFSVVTASFNRAELLLRCYQSLEAQTFRDFEWIVCDDGSTDDTHIVLEEIARRATFPFRYFRQKNQGKATAVRQALALVCGVFVLTLDSDDYLLPDALARMRAAWLSIPEDARKEYCGVVGLCETPDGQMIGTSFPSSPIDTNFVWMRTHLHVRGDKCGPILATVRRDFLHPTGFNGVNQEGLLFTRMARHYRCRCVNEVFQIVDYQSDGLSRRRRGLPAPSSARYLAEYQRELLAWDLGFWDRFLHTVSYYHYGIRGRLGPRELLGCVPKRPWAWLVLPVAILAYLRAQLTRRKRPRGERNVASVN